MTTSLSRGIATVTSFRLCSRAPRITICSCGTNPPATAFSTGTAPESSSLSEGERMFGEWYHGAPDGGPQLGLPNRRSREHDEREPALLPPPRRVDGDLPPAGRQRRPRAVDRRPHA